MSLKAARVNANLKQEDVINALDISNKTLISWESGKTHPKPAQIDALCELYGAKYDDIIF